MRKKIISASKVALCAALIALFAMVGVERLMVAQTQTYQSTPVMPVARVDVRVPLNVRSSFLERIR